VQTDGDVVIGAAVTPGVAYYLSDTPGGICPVADLAAGEYPALLGMAKSATVITLNIEAPQVSL
jgi:predicted lysophospholipase L1 biosynthesis ABC-type transport system permease subunit